MRPPRVVVRGVHGKHPAQVPLTEDQHPIGDLGPDGQHEALGETVRPRTPRRDLHHRDARVRHHRVELRRELTGPIADEELVAKITDVVGLCLAPPENAVVLCVDEKSRAPRGADEAVRDGRPAAGHRGDRSKLEAD
jgi:hypothetical protein